MNLKTAERPKETFTKSPHVLEDSTRRVEFHHFGWAHTKGDGFAYLPKEKILCTGDAVLNGPFNFTGDGNIRNWPKVARAAQKLEIERILPGHGAPGGKDLLEGQALFMEELRGAVTKARREGKKLGDIVRLEDGKPVSTSVQLSDRVKTWTGKNLPAQLTDAWLEMEKGKPRGDLKI